MNTKQVSFLCILSDNEATRKAVSNVGMAHQTADDPLSVKSWSSTILNNDAPNSHMGVRSRSKKPKFSEDHSEVSREGAEEVDTLKACINVDHMRKKLGTAAGGRRLARLLPSNLQKELQVRNGKSCTFITEK